MYPNTYIFSNHTLVVTSSVVGVDVQVFNFFHGLITQTSSTFSWERVTSRMNYWNEISRQNYKHTWSPEVFRLFRFNISLESSSWLKSLRRNGRRWLLGFLSNFLSSLCYRKINDRSSETEIWNVQNQIRWITSSMTFWIASTHSWATSGLSLEHKTTEKDWHCTENTPFLNPIALITHLLMGNTLRHFTDAPVQSLQ